MDAIDRGSPADGMSPPLPGVDRSRISGPRRLGRCFTGPSPWRASAPSPSCWSSWPRVSTCWSGSSPVLRPLLIAILLCYLFLPVYTRLRRYMRPVFSFLIIAVGITLGLQGLARMVYRDVVLIDQNLPRYMSGSTVLENHLRELSKSILPWLQRSRAADTGRRPGRHAHQRALAADRPGCRLDIPQRLPGADRRRLLHDLPAPIRVPAAGANPVQLLPRAGEGDPRDHPVDQPGHLRVPGREGQGEPAGGASPWVWPAGLSGSPAR